MNKSVRDVMIGLFAEVLSCLEYEDERMKKLEEFDDVCGAEIRGWEEMMKKKIKEIGGRYVLEAMQSVDDYYSKNHVYDEKGNPIYERFRIGNSLHQVIITYDSNAPDGFKFSFKEVPEIEAMSLDELQAYYEELQSRMEELSDEEPEGDDNTEYEEWEDASAQLEDLLEEVAERLEGMGGDV